MRRVRGRARDRRPGRAHPGRGRSAHVFGMSSGAVLALRAAAAGWTSIAPSSISRRSASTPAGTRRRPTSAAVRRAGGGRRPRSDRELLHAPRDGRARLLSASSRRATDLRTSKRSRTRSHTTTRSWLTRRRHAARTRAVGVDCDTDPHRRRWQERRLAPPRRGRACCCMPNAERRTLAGQSHNLSMKLLAPVLEEFLLDRR